MNPFFANGGAIGGAGSLTVGFTGFTTIGDTDGLVRVVGLALIVCFALDATASTIAVLPLGTILVGTTNTLVVFGALFGGTGFALTLLVFQAGDTASAGSLFQDQTTLWTFFTSRKNNRSVTTTGC